MPHTETYYVSTEDNEVRETTNNISSYFLPIYDKKNYGKAKYCIEVFGYNHKETATKIRDIIDKEGMSDKLFKIRVETK
jgi:hypothetical protein